MPVEISVVLPCLNEAATLRGCVQQIGAVLRSSGLAGEIIVADNGSTDGSRQIAEEVGARVVRVAERGYGSALMGGIAAATGHYIVIGDADGQHNFDDIPRFVGKLDDGCDLVVGNRFGGVMQPKAMSFLNRYIGNPLLSGLGRWLFKAPCRDFHCGLRAFRSEACERMDLRAKGMEFASEMIVKACLMGMRITEAPTSIAPSLRRPHLRQFRDGWRHLVLLLRFALRRPAVTRAPKPSSTPAEAWSRFNAD